MIPYTYLVRYLSFFHVYRLIQKGIALYTAHTNLDAAPGGINDILADRLGLVDIDLLLPTVEEKLYKVGSLSLWVMRTGAAGYVLTGRRGG